MAIHATFEDAGALQPESSPDANRLIKALIQFQAALMKSDAEPVRRLLNAALPTDEAAQFRSRGWTSRSLEAVIDYADRHPIWNDPATVQAFAPSISGRRILRCSRRPIAMLTRG